MVEENMARQVGEKKRQQVTKLAIGSAMCGVIAGGLIFLVCLHIFTRNLELENMVISIVCLCATIGLGAGLIAITLMLQNKCKDVKSLLCAIVGVVIGGFILWSMIDVVPKNKIRQGRLGVNETNQVEQQIGIREGNEVLK